MQSADGDAAAVVDGFDKLIVNRHNGIVEHYDLRSDPHELHAKGTSARRDALECLVAGWLTQKDR